MCKKIRNKSLKKHLNLACKCYQAWVAVNKENKQGALDGDCEDDNMRVCKVFESVSDKRQMR